MPVAADRRPRTAIGSTLPAVQRVLLDAVLRLLTFFWSHGVPLVLVVLALLATTAAYQVPFRATENLADSPLPLRLAGFHRAEAAPEGFQRWSSGRARIVVPGVGAGAATLRLRFFGGAELGAGRTLTVYAGERLLAQAPVRPYWQELRLNMPRGAADPASGDLTLALELPPFSPPGDARPLGVSFGQVELIPHTGGPYAPPLNRAAELALVTLLLFWALRIIGASVRGASLGAGAALLGLAVLLAGWPGGAVALRLQGAAALPLLLRVLPLTLLLALALRIGDLRRRLFAAGASIKERSRTGAKESLKEQPYRVMLRLAVLLVFSLRLAGVLHPQFVNVDQGLRANQVLALAAGRIDLVLPRLEQQYEWGTREPVPYTLLTYYMLLPLAWIWDNRPDLVIAVKGFTALLDATVPLLLWALLRGGPQREGAAAWAGLCYAALPIGYLFFHDGSFPTTLGLWIVLLALVSVRWSMLDAAGATLPDLPLPRPTLLQWLVCLAALALAIGAYVTHVAFVPFLVGALALSLFQFSGAAAPRRAGLRIGGLLAVALLAAWLVFYGSYTLTLFQRTIPAYLGLLAEDGAVGRDAGSFFGTPINTFWQHLVAHFRVWPVLLAGAALLLLLARWRDRFVTHLGLAFAALFVATSLAERWFGLWNKHMAFVAPGVALLSGVGLAWIWRRGLAGRAVCVLLMSYLFWESSRAWGNRVLWYMLPPEAL